MSRVGSIGDEAAALVAGEHADPFAVLGVHRRAGAWVACALVHGASTVEAIAADGTPLRVTASFGLACATTTHQPGLEALLAEADAALYQAKAEGRDRVVAASEPGA